MALVQSAGGQLLSTTMKNMKNRSQVRERIRTVIKKGQESYRLMKSKAKVNGTAQGGNEVDKQQDTSTLTLLSSCATSESV